MGNHENPILKLRKPLSVLGVIRETMNTVVRNKRCLQRIVYLVLLINMRFEAATRWDMEPLQQEFGFQITARAAGQHANRGADELHMLKFHMLFLPYCLYLYSIITAIFSSFESYTRNTLSILDSFLKVIKISKKILLTGGCIFFLTLGINIVYSFCFVMIPFFVRRRYITSSSTFYIAGIVIKWICNVHVATLWTMSLVVTVLEDNICGFKAISRARDLMKGNRIQASMAIMVYYIACLVVAKTFEESQFEDLTMWSIKIQIPFLAWFRSLFKVFVFVLYTVLYHECKMNHKKDEILRARNVASKSL